MTLNRKQAPELHGIELESLPSFDSEQLANGVDFHVLNILQEDIIQVEFVLSVGKMDETKKMQLQLLAGQIKEGTSNRSAKEIADALEFYGGSVKSYHSSDTFHLQLTCLTRFLDQLFPIFLEVFLDPVFPEKELNDFKSRQAQKLLIREQKVDFLADRLLFESLFGSEHNYGYGNRREYLESISHQDLQTFHRDHFNTKPLAVFVNGNIGQEQRLYIKQHAGSLSKRGNNDYQSVQASTNQSIKKYSNKDGAIQSAIRVARIGIPSYHSTDHARFLLTNLILGGYFGSRLMSNIREDKGYTYGIYSYPGMLKNDSYWMVSTETGKHVADNALSEIYHELDRMRSELVSEDELNLTKNYFLGNLLNRLSGSFKITRAFIELNKHHLDLGYYLSLEKQIKNITAAEIKDTARRWFDPADLSQIIVGP